MIDGKKSSAMLPNIWKNFFNNGIVIPVKNRFCNGCGKEKCCDRFNILVNENKKFEANLGLLKREAPNEFCHMLAYHKL